MEGLIIKIKVQNIVQLKGILCMFLNQLKSNAIQSVEKDDKLGVLKI